MNKKARLNYIHALSTQVEHKKMYKAKKQWVVAGISFLVATGMGAIGSHLTTHADVTNNQQTTSVAPKLASGSASSNANNQKFINNNVSSSANSDVKQPASSSAVEQQAKALHNQVVNNNAQKPHFNSAYENYLKDNPQLASFYNSTANPNSSELKSNNQNKPNKTESNIKSSNVITGTWGSSNYTFQNGNLTLSGGIISQFPSTATNNLKWSDVHNIYTNGVTAPTDMGDTFHNLPNLQNANLSGVNFSNTTDMMQLFAGDTNLQSVTFGNKSNTSQVTDMSAMFQACPNLKHIYGINNLDTYNVTNLGWMFSDDKSLSDLDLSSFDTYKAFNNNKVYGNSNGLISMISDINPKTIKLGSNTVLNQAALGGTENNSYALDNDGNPFKLIDGNNHAGTWNLLKNISNQGTWGSTNWVLTKNGDLYLNGGVLNQHQSDAKNYNGQKLDWNNVYRIYTNNVIAPVDMGDTFAHLTSLQTADLSGINFSNTTDMMQLFDGDNSLQNITFNPHVNTSQVIDMGGAFQSCSDLKHIYGLNDFDTHNVAAFDWTFSGDTSLSDLDLSSFDTRKAYNNDNVFNSVNGLIAMFSDTNLNTIKLGDNTYLYNPNNTRNNKPSLQGSWISNSFSPVHVNLNDGQAHAGDWTRNAEIIDFQYKNKQGTTQTVASDVIYKPVGTNENVSDAPLDIPSKYHVINSNQNINISGGITQVPVELASDFNNDEANSIADSAEDVATYSLASEIVQSDVTKVSALASEYSKNTNITSAKTSLASIQGSFNTATRSSNNVSNVLNYVSQANSAYDSAYAENTSIASEASSNGSLASSEVASLTSASASGKITISGIASNVANGLIDSLFSNDNSGSNSTLASVANSIASIYAKSLTSNSSVGTTTISGIASGIASNMISNSFGSNISASGSTIASVASTVAENIASNYELKASESADISALIYGSGSASGTIPYMASSYAQSVASSLTNMSSSASATTISTIASNMIASLFGNSASNSTIASVANSVADSYLTNDIQSKYVSDGSSVVASANSAWTNANAALSAIGINASGQSNGTNSSSNIENELSTINNTLNEASSAINWVNSNSKAVTSNIGSLASEKTKVRKLAIQAYSVETSELNQINSAVGNKSNVSPNYSNAKQAMSQATDAANDAVKDAQIIQGEINSNNKNINTNATSIGNINQQLSNYANVSADATSAMSSLDTDNSALSWLVNSLGSVESETTQASSNATWISNNSASVSSLNTEWKSINSQINSDSLALNNAINTKANGSELVHDYDTLSGNIKTASGIATKASDLANANKESISKDSTAISNLQNKVNSDENEYNSISANASNALTSLANEDSRIGSNANWISSNSGSVASLKNEFSSVNNQFGTDEKVLNTNINTKAPNSDLTKDYNQLIDDINKASGIASSAQSLANNNTKSITNNSNWIKNNASNVSNTAVEANNAESSASNALKQLEDMSGLKPSDITSLSNAISNANNQISKDSSALSYAVQAKANDDKLADDYKNLNNDISHMNNMVNSNTFNSLANKVANNNKQINSLANKPTPTPISNPTINYSGLDSLTSEVNDNNQAINSLANKPTSSATINNDYLNELVNSGITRLTNEVNARFNSGYQPAKTTPTNVHKTSSHNLTYIKWIMVVKPLRLYRKASLVGTNHGAVKILRPNHEITLAIKKVIKVHHGYVFEVNYNHHNYFAAYNHKLVRNSYLPVNHKLVGKRVRVTNIIYAYKHKTSRRVKTLHKGYSARIKNIVRIGNHNVTRIQLADGLWISANMNYVEVL